MLIGRDYINKWVFILLMLLSSPALAETELSGWVCEHIEKKDFHIAWLAPSADFYVCIQQKTGLDYQSTLPLTKESLEAYQEKQQRDREEADCTCSREIHDGAQSGNGFICTGALSPYVLRKRKVDPCKGGWEK